ncbi:lipase family protein [Rhodopirellula sp. JC639]|uniref:lipase family protein n=1 Tax=Stieleria mannarensis TaxID=2755585 RepID=UPI0016023B1E|nr:Mbeg1-like protein [Rhodopirellula sp. JC639]
MAASGGDGADWTSAFVSLESALAEARLRNNDVDSANDVDEVWIAEGTYRPQRIWDSTSRRLSTFEIPNGVSLVGGFAGSETVADQRPREADGTLALSTVLSGDLDANDDPALPFTSVQEHRIDENVLTVVWVRGDQSVKFDGLTITGGWAESTNIGFGNPTDIGLFVKHLVGGAAVLVTGSGTVDLVDSVVSRNYSGFGGAVRSEVSPLVVAGTQFIENVTNSISASNGGAIYAGGGLSVSSSVFVKNEAEKGGAIYSVAESTVQDSRFEFNRADVGGAVYAAASLAVSETDFFDNESVAGIFGGGGAIHGSGAVEVFGGTFSGNTTTQGLGGAIWAERVDLDSTTFSGNVAFREGGAIYATQQVLANGSTFMDNQGSIGGAIATELTGQTTLTNSTINRNVSTSRVGAVSTGSATVHGSTIQGNIADRGIGGIDAFGDIVVSDSSIRDNQGVGLDATGRIEVTNSRISGNSSGGLTGGVVTVADSTIADNEDGGGIIAKTSLTMTDSIVRNNSKTGDGGGILSNAINITDSTIYSNRSTGAGGGVSRFSGSASANFIISGSSISNNTAGSSGGAIWGRDLNLIDSRVSANVATGDGGGILGERMTITGSVLTSNKSGLRGGAVSATELDIEESVLSSNESESDGGAVKASQVAVTRSRLDRNESGGGGGAVHADSVTAIDSSFNENIATGTGGAFSTSSFTAQRSNFFGNHSGGRGGAALGNGTIIESTLIGNVAAADGGAVYGDVIAEASTFLKNQSGGQGGAIRGSNVSLFETDVLYNESQDDGGGIHGYIISLNASEVLNNRSQTRGGGIYGSQVQLSTSKVLANIAGGDGGGIYVTGGVDSSSSKIGNNEAGGNGGGVHGSIDATNTTVSRNEAGGDFGGGIFGGATLVDSRVSSNTASTLGGGIYGGVSELAGTTVVGNGLISPPDRLDPATNEPVREYHDYPRDGQGAIVDYNRIVYRPGEDIYSTGRSLQTTDSTIGELNHHYSPVTVVGLTAVIGTLSIEFGQPATFDGSDSIEATAYNWDLDHDGEYDDGSGQTLRKTWAELDSLGFSVGVHYIGLQVSSVDEQGEPIFDTAVARITVFSTDEQDDDQPIHPEIVARYLAYEDLEPETQVGYGNYVVDKVFRSGEFFAIGLVLRTAQGEESEPILAFRGTDSNVELLTIDTNVNGVGYSQYVNNRSAIRSWLTEQKGQGNAVQLVGHSLGGALAQWFAVDWLQLDPTNRLAAITTYNSPGIDSEFAELFDARRAGAVVHHIVDGDFVSMAGDRFIDGQVKSYFMNTLSPINKHLLPVQLPQVPVAGSREGDSKACDSGSVRCNPGVTPGDLTIESLNSFWFHYTSYEYYGVLLAAQIAFGAADDVGVAISGRRFQPAMLVFRGTAEFARTQFGQTLPQILGVEPVDPTLDKLVIDEIKAPFLPFSLKKLELERTPEHGVKVGATFDFPFVDLRGELEFRASQIYSARIEISPEKPWPIFTSGLFLSKAGLEVGNLTRFFSVEPRPGEPPEKLRLTGIGELTFLPEAELEFPKELERWTGSLSLSVALAKFGGELTVEIYKLDDQWFIDFSDAEAEFSLVLAEFNGAPVFRLAHGTGSVNIDPDQDRSVIEGTIELLGGVIHGEAQIVMDSSSERDELRLRDQLVVDIAQIIPFVDFDPSVYTTTLYVTDDTNNRSNEFLRVEASEVGWFNVGFEARFDGTFDYWIGMREETPATAVGTRAYRSSSTLSPRTAVVIQSESPVGSRQLRIRKPDGTVILQNEFNNLPDIALSTSIVGETVRVLKIQQDSSTVRTWVIDFVEGDLNIQTSYFVDDTPPSLQIDPPTTMADGSVGLSFQLTDPDSDARVSFYLDHDHEGFDGYEIARNLGETEQSFRWQPYGLRSGTYYVYSVVRDGVNPPIAAYLDQQVTIETSAELMVTDSSGVQDDQYVHFGNRTADSTNSELHWFTLENIGNGPADIDDLIVTGQSINEFDVTYDGVPLSGSPSQKRVIYPGESVRVELQAFPQSGGAKFIDLQIDGNFQQRPLTLSATMRSLPRAAKVLSAEIDDASGQRSIIRTITVTFDKLVDIDPNAFTVTKVGTLGGPVDVQVKHFCDVAGNTTVKLEFSGEQTINGSLLDGHYELIIDADQVFSEGLLLDGGSGAGTDYVDHFFRFFGDSDGDGDVDGQDYGRFGLTFLRNSDREGFDPIFDFDRDGDVDGQDYGQFGLRFLRTL